MILCTVVERCLVQLDIVEGSGLRTCVLEPGEAIYCVSVSIMMRKSLSYFHCWVNCFSPVHGPVEIPLYYNPINPEDSVRKNITIPINNPLDLETNNFSVVKSILKPLPGKEPVR
jgi:hypothetical protein